LYVVESRLPGITTLSRAGGWTGTRRIHTLLPGTVPDGLAVDANGRVYVGCWRPDRVYLLSTGREPTVLLDDPTGEYLTTPTNACFGGDDMRRLYLASISGWTIQTLHVETPGQPLPRPRRGPG
jgi:gluconolactonase